ncbi:MAG: hypothetical protein ACLUAR_12050 [Pilosibacter sp.]
MSPLTINSSNVNQLNGKTITGSYCPSTRPELTYKDIKGGITIDNVTVDLTIKNVTIKSDGARGWNLAGIYLKGNAQLNLTLEGKILFWDWMREPESRLRKMQRWLLQSRVKEA